VDFDLITGGSAVLLIVAIIQIAKSFGMDTKYSPIISVIIGVAASLALAYYGESMGFIAVARGLFVGLSAVGLYSGVKNTVEKIKS